MSFQSRRRRRAALHVFVLANLAIALPLFDVLADGVNFFVAQRAQPSDVIWLVIVLCAGVPAALLGIELAVGTASIRAQRAAHLTVVAILTGLYALRIGVAADGLHPGLALAAAAAAGAAATAAYARIRAARMFLEVLSPAALLIPLWFLFLSPVAAVVLDGPNVEEVALDFESKPPIVFVVLDELPTFTLLDAEGEIDPERFPNFARLARMSTWYPNATTVADGTPTSITAMLTGRLVGQDLAATHGAHPQNLFAALRGTYDLNVWETLTRLLPRGDYSAADDRTSIRRLRDLLEDVSVVGAHVITPSAWRSHLPSIARAWGGFIAPPTPALARRNVGWKQQLKSAGRGTAFDRFIASIRDSGSPTLNFFHSLLPHSPYVHLPSGRRHDAPTESLDEPDRRGRWRRVGPEARLIALQHRHLLQTVFVDTLLGRLLDHLAEIHLLDSALIVVTADHGVAFAEGEFARTPSPPVAAENLFVPLFIKRPGQRAGEHDMRNVETVDVAPTIIAMLGGTTPWPTNGASLLDPPIRRPVKRFHSTRIKARTMPRREAQRRRTEALGRTVERFDVGREGASLFAFGPWRDAIGSTVPLQVPTAAGLTVEITHAELRTGTRREEDVLPAYVAGTVTGDRSVLPGDSDAVAIAVDGVIRGVAQLGTHDGATSFELLLPEEVAAARSPSLSIYLPSRTPGGSLRFERLAEVAR